MLADLASWFQKEELGRTVAVICVVIWISTIPFCFYKRSWPDIGATVIMLLSTIGVISGFKIAFFTLYLPLHELGPLTDDKPALIIGGLATFVFSLREATANWRKVANI
jgi:hypothetical protein